MPIQAMLFDSSVLSMSQTFYPSGCVFAMLPDADAAQQAAAALEQVRGIDGVSLALPQSMVDQWSKRAEEIRDNPPSVGREEQFQVRFLELAENGGHGLLIKLGSNTDQAQATEVLVAHQCSVAYEYGRLVIEEWISPSSSAKQAAADTK